MPGDAAASRPRRFRDSSAGAHLTILVVDDHPGFRRALVSVLHRPPAVVVVGAAADGEEAVALATGLRPDVVVMDLVMPGMNGVEATRDLVARGCATRVVALSGSRELMTDALAAGASATVLKDADPAELIAAVRAVQQS